VDRCGYTPLHWASKKRHLEVVQLLLAKGADAGHGWMPLHSASEKGHVEVVQLLLQAAARRGRRRRTWMDAAR
jgi:ankyrin repeat protein